MASCQAAEAHSTAPADKISFTGVAVEPADEHGMTALHKAAVEGSTALVQQLLEAGAAVHATAAGAQNCTALHMASHKGYAAVVKLLLDAQAAVDAADSTGCTAVAVGLQPYTKQLQKACLQWCSCCWTHMQQWMLLLSKVGLHCIWQQAGAMQQWCSCC
jgi:hypothetical protein